MENTKDQEKIVDVVKSHITDQRASAVCKKSKLIPFFM